MPAALAVGPAAQLPPAAELQAQAAALDYDATDFVAGCSTPTLLWNPPARPDAPRVAVIDYGAKRSTPDRLRARGAGVWVVPATWTADQILALRPDGVLLSNGPGDPSRLDYAVETVRGLLAQPNLPDRSASAWGTNCWPWPRARARRRCASATAASTSRCWTTTGRVALTTQNHGYVVDPEGIPAGYHITHRNLNDGTVEGLAHERAADVAACNGTPKPTPVPPTPTTCSTSCSGRRGGIAMPLRIPSIRKVLIIGSGPDRHRPGGRVRLRGHAGLPRPARGGHRGRPRQLATRPRS